MCRACQRLDSTGKSSSCWPRLLGGVQDSPKGWQQQEAGRILTRMWVGQDAWSTETAESSSTSVNTDSSKTSSLRWWASRDLRVSSSCWTKPRPSSYIRRRCLPSHKGPKVLPRCRRSLIAWLPNLLTSRCNRRTLRCKVKALFRGDKRQITSFLPAFRRRTLLKGHCKPTGNLDRLLRSLECNDTVAQPSHTPTTFSSRQINFLKGEPLMRGILN